MAPPPEQRDATAVKDILSQLSQDKTVLEEVRKIALRVSFKGLYVCLIACSCEYLCLLIAYL